MKLSEYSDEEVSNIISTKEKYRVRLDGGIVDINTRQELEPSLIDSGEKYFTITGDDGVNYLLKHSVIMALSFKRPLLKPKLWPLLDVFYIDGDKTNIHPGNLIWKYPNEGIQDDELEGFRYIPGYSKYLINRKGVVFNRVEKKVMAVSMRDGFDNGYPSVHIKPDRKHKVKTCRLHRLLAFAFIPYSSKVDKLDVNHKDGNKKNFDLDNLEWASRGVNCNHAYATGLRSDNIPIQVKDIYSGDVFEFYSDGDCLKYFNAKLGQFRARAKSRGQKIFDYGMLVREVPSDKDWAIIKDPVNQTYKDTKRIAVEITDSETGVKTQFDTVDSASESTGIPPSSIRYYLKRNTKEAVYGYFLNYANLEILNKSFFDEIRSKKAPLIAGNPRL